MSSVTFSVTEAALTLLVVYSGIYLGWGSRPTERDRTTYVHRVDLNHASRAELLQLPGVGESMAGRIEDYRHEHGGFRKVDDLVKIHGVGPATLERLRGWVYVHEEEAEEDLRPLSATARRVSKEGQEGLNAFLEKRTATWIKDTKVTKDTKA